MESQIQSEFSYFRFKSFNLQNFSYLRNKSQHFKDFKQAAPYDVQTD